MCCKNVIVQLAQELCLSNMMLAIMPVQHAAERSAAEQTTPRNSSVATVLRPIAEGGDSQLLLQNNKLQISCYLSIPSKQPFSAQVANIPQP
jgi:hypothetical protein